MILSPAVRNGANALVNLVQIWYNTNRNWTENKILHSKTVFGMDGKSNMYAFSSCKS